MESIIKKIRQFLGTPEYLPGTILVPNKEYPDNHLKMIVLSRPKKHTAYNKNSNCILCAEYPIKDINASGYFSYNTLRKYYNTTTIDRSAAILYGQTNPF